MSKKAGKEKPAKERATNDKATNGTDLKERDVRRLTSVEKLPTGIPSFDMIAEGGIPKNRTTLLSGTAGSGKTVFAIQFLAAGIEAGESGVFVTFEEPPSDIRQNMAGFGWDIEAWEREGRFAFVDASPDPETEAVESGHFDLSALVARVRHAVQKVGAQRVSVDSLGAIFSQFSNQAIVRQELFRIASALKNMGVTAVLTAERTEDYGGIARHGVEEFIADNVMVLRNVLEDEKRRRTIEIIKFRGTTHQKGQFPFTIVSGIGMVVIPLSAIQLRQKSSDVRISSGSRELDEMCGGGFFRDSVILLSGATGTGKTLTVTQFLAGGAAAGERCLLLAFEESRDQLFRNARGWGMDFEKMEKDGLLKVISEYPEVAGLEDWLIQIKSMIEDFGPARVALDSLSALERMGTVKAFREFVISLTSFIKHKEITGLFTSTTSALMGGPSITEGHISTLTDSIILLRYVEMFGEMKRGMTVLKMRGSIHDKAIREFTIDASGMHIGRAFHHVTGILAGAPVHLAPGDVERVWEAFDARIGERRPAPSA
jgi:circadian clock protein KaiC